MDQGINLSGDKTLKQSWWWLFTFCTLFFASQLQAGQCGTPLLFEPGKKPIRGGLKSGNGYRTTIAVDNRARTLETEHFLIHYSLRGLHKVRTGAEDARLMKSTDSLFTVFSFLSGAKRDSAVYFQLDLMNAPHPIYIRQVEKYFEDARKYYVTILGMKAPVANIYSVQYKITASLPRKFPIDIVDVGTADRDFFGETYAVTYPPDRLSITFENDFLWDTQLDSQGKILGKSIKSQVSGKVLHDYGEEWELGVKVTAYHEFYHAVQFTYNPRVLSYHAWYEISAVGMEERNAPEVNDYFQYLPCVLKNHDRVALTTMSQGPCSHYPMYGHGIFHIFLSHALDSTFDVKVWTELSRNGDVLHSALESCFSKYGKTMGALYSEYTSQLLFSGLRFQQPPNAFSVDIPRWGDIAEDSVDMSDATPYRSITLPALTFAVLKISRMDRSIIKVLQTRGAKGLTRIHASKDSAIIEHLQVSQLTLGDPRPDFQSYYIVIPNPSFTQDLIVEVKEPEASFYAFPNPVHSTPPSAIYFSQAKAMTFPATIQIFGENGAMLRSLDFASSDSSLIWDLRDNGAHLLKPGIYYYRLNSENLKPLVLLR